jgi:hypothetical protein
VTDIEHFVRGTLGCGCPDEVFRSVSVRRLPPVIGRIAHTEILVGSRLLIRVLEAPDDAAGEWLERAVADGRATRDRCGYNRFRLVLVAPASKLRTIDREGLDARFARAPARDERVHLHLLDEDQLPESLRVAPPPETTAGIAAPSPAAATLAK